MSKKYIADTLKRLREAVGLTTIQVGKLIGKSGKTVSAWENGRGQPDAEILIQLCDIYKVNNLLAEFDESDNLKKESTISDTEISMINKYRSAPAICIRQRRSDNNIRRCAKNAEIRKKSHHESIILSVRLFLFQHNNFSLLKQTKKHVHRYIASIDFVHTKIVLIYPL